MAEIATITIGGKPFEIAPLNFKRIKRIWPLVAKADTMSDDPANAMEAIDACITIISIALEPSHPEMDVDKIEEELMGDEFLGLKTAMVDMLVVSGLASRKDIATGEAEGASAAPSTVTGTE